jgi:multidrug efflux system outer membrane protein
MKRQQDQRAIAASLALFFALVGCTVGPSYHRPSALGTNAAPASFSGADQPTPGVVWKSAEPSAHLPRGSWWQIFDDPELNRLEDFARANNQEVAAALARFDQARASVQIARANFFPQLSVDPSFTRQRTSFNQPLNGRRAEVAHTYNTFSLALDAGWEVDLWGRVRRQTQAARARLAASSDDIEGVRLAVHAEIAADYFLLRAIDSELDLLQRNTETFQRSLELTVNRRKGGIATDLDVAQAETQLQTTEAALPALRLQRSQVDHALAVLCGQAATGFDVETDRAELKEVPAAPVSLPSELLERRPDIAASERRVAAANADIGVAQAAFYPRLRFSGLAGFESVGAPTLFDWPSRLWSLGPSVDLPIFTGGRNRAGLDFSKAAYQETVANYRATALKAFQEVEDQLAAQRLLADQLNAERKALTSAQRTLEIATNRYKAGLITYLEVATAQSAALNLERTVVELRGEKLVATVALIKALGGGWAEEFNTTSR